MGESEREQQRPYDEALPRVPPHSVEAEQSVIGGLLLNNDAVDRLDDLQTEHFYVADHRAIFEVVIRMLTDGKPADVITVYEAMKGKNERNDWLPYLNSLSQNTPSAANINRYATIVRDRAIKRGLLALSLEIDDVVFDSGDEAVAMLDTVAGKLEKIAEVRRKSEPVRASEEIGAHVAQLEDRESDKNRAISTGLYDLDRRLSGGLRGGELIVLGGRPGMGKTALAMEIARFVAVEHVVTILSMEMPRAQLHDRNLAALGQIPLDRLLQPSQMEDRDWAQVVHATNQIEGLNLFIDDQGALRLLDVRMKARRVKRRHGLKLLVIDYLQLMEGKGDNRNAQIEAITRGLKALAKEEDLTVLLLAQLNRELEKRANKRPVVSDLRDSGSIEQDADVILFVYRDEVYNPDSPDKGLCEVDVAKIRQGATGRFNLQYIAPQVRFETSDRVWSPPLLSAPSRGRRSINDE